MWSQTPASTKHLLSRMLTVGLSAPQILTIAITNRCNLHCQHCWVNADTGNSTNQISLENLKIIIKEFAYLDGKAIRLTGGEPLLHPDIHELFQYIAANKLQLLLQTNGSLLDTTHFNVLKKIPLLNIQISLDGASSLTHDKIRGEGAFDKVFANLQQLISLGFSDIITISLTEMQHNIGEIANLFLCADNLGIKSVQTGTLVLCGRAATNKLATPATAKQYSQLIDQYICDDKFRKRYDAIGTIAILEWYKYGIKPTQCTFIENPYLTTNGTLFPCLMCHIEPYSISNVFEKGLHQSFLQGLTKWMRLATIHNNRSNKIEECQQCSLLTQCAGGCLGRSWEAFGSLFANEDRCKQRKIVIKLQNQLPQSTNTPYDTTTNSPV